MGRIQQTTTTTSYNTDGITHSTSTISVRELDEGEVGILMAGNNSILDPSLTPHLLTPVDYDISECDLTDSDELMMENSEDDEYWSSSLSQAFGIEELDNSDGDELMVNDILYATDVIEVDDHEPETKRLEKLSTGLAGKWTVEHGMDNGSNISSLDESDIVVPLEIVYTVLD
ncbi:hypothetical protein BC941DRAFT_409497, partial [Chlamydoabsidia padenii]